MFYNTYIIIVTYNGMQWLERCLLSIPPKYKVIIVDNKSNDNTLSFIKKQYPNHILFEEKGNLGFGKANNLGISYALKQGAEHVFLLNQDAYLVDNVLEKLIDFQSKNKQYGILSPIHVNADQTKLDRNFSKYLRYNKNPYFISDHVLGNPLKEVYNIPFVNAAGWLLSRTCLMTVGGFDPIFYHYGEDDNYCQRVLYHGFKIGVFPKAFLIHDREERDEPRIKLFSKEYYARELRKFKVNYANVNVYTELSINKYKNRIRKDLIKAFIKNDRQRIKNLKAYLELVKQTIPKIEVSVETNIKSKPNYLDL